MICTIAPSRTQVHPRVADVERHPVRRVARRVEEHAGHRGAGAVVGGSRGATRCPLTARASAFSIVFVRHVAAVGDRAQAFDGARTGDLTADVSAHAVRDDEEQDTRRTWRPGSPRVGDRCRSPPPTRAPARRRAPGRRETRWKPPARRVLPVRCTETLRPASSHTSGLLHGVLGLGERLHARSAPWSAAGRQRHARHRHQILVLGRALELRRCRAAQ